MQARHRHHHSSERPKTFTKTLESCSRSSGIGVHDAVETAFTNSRNMQVVSIVIAVLSIIIVITIVASGGSRSSDRNLPGISGKIC
jgi:hypothetical protein